MNKYKLIKKQKDSRNNFNSFNNNYNYNTNFICCYY